MKVSTDLRALPSTKALAILDKVRVVCETRRFKTSWWLMLLKHRDTDVRRVALERLSRWVDAPKVRMALCETLLDQTSPAYREPPALHAGLVLRRARRDEHFHQTLPALIAVAKHGGTLEAGAVALALQPGEAPAQLLARNLYALSRQSLVFPDILEELAALPEGAAALEKVWPDWRNVEHLRPEEPFAPASGPIGDSPPLSQPSLRTMLRAIGPAMAQWSPDERRQFNLSITDQEVTRALCEAAWEHPQGVLERLEAPGELILSPDEGIHLGEAVARHPELRAALLSRWERTDESERQYFPGEALSLLVARGDDVVAKTYAEWLRVSFRLRGFTSLSLPPAALQHPAVRPIAIERAKEMWWKYRDGWPNEEGGRSYIPGGMMCNVLRSLRPAWEGASELKEEILLWARDAQGHGGHAFAYALGIFSKPPYPRALTDLLVERFNALVEQSRNEDEPRSQYHLPFLLHWAERVGIADKLQCSLERICTWNSWLRYQATAMLFPVRPGLAADLSQRAAESWPHDWDPELLSRGTLSYLVRANVNIWNSRLLDALKENMLPIRAVFLLARALLPLLPLNSRELLEITLYKKLGDVELSWVQNSQYSWDTIRYADLYAQVVFETGGRFARREYARERSMDRQESGSR